MNSLNEDEEGEACPACADRLLETLPGVFHRPWMETWSGHVDVDADGAVELTDDADDDLVDELADELADERPTTSRRDDDTFADPDQPA